MGVVDDQGHPGEVGFFPGLPLGGDLYVMKIFIKGEVFQCLKPSSYHCTDDRVVFGREW